MAALQNCDGAPLYSGWLATIQAADGVATTAAFGRSVVQAALPQLSVRVVHHGVDASVFRPLTDARLPAFADRFFVGCVARNVVRKQLPLLIRAFAAFRRTAPNALLYLHTDPRDPEGWDLPDLVRRFGLGDNAALPGDLTAARGVDDETLARVYAQFDVFALPTMGEGFGLPILEAMACGVPVIATDCSAVTELVLGCGRLIRPCATVTGSYNVDQAMPDVDHLTELLAELQASAELRRELSELGLRRAAGMTWDRAAEAMLETLRSL